MRLAVPLTAVLLALGACAETGSTTDANATLASDVAIDVGNTIGEPPQSVENAPAGNAANAN